VILLLNEQSQNLQIINHNIKDFVWLSQVAMARKMFSSGERAYRGPFHWSLGLFLHLKGFQNTEIIARQELIG